MPFNFVFLCKLSYFKPITIHEPATDDTNVAMDELSSPGKNIYYYALWNELKNML